MVALIDFQDGCGNENLYGSRAELIAVCGLKEFQAYQRREEVTERVFGRAIREIETFNNPIAASARKMLQQMPSSLLAETMNILLRSDNTHLQCDAAKLVGELKLYDDQVIESLTNLALDTEFKDTRCYAFCSLLTVDPNNLAAINGLIQILDSQDMYALPFLAAQTLRYASTEKERVIQALDNLLESQVFNGQPILPMQQESACAAAFSLLKHNPEHGKAKFVLQALAEAYWAPTIRVRIINALEKLGIAVPNAEANLKNQTTQEIFQEDLAERLNQLELSLDLDDLTLIEKLVDIMINNQLQSCREQAAWCLELLLSDRLPFISLENLPKVVSLLKNCLDTSPDRNTVSRRLISVGTQDPIIACYKGLWSIIEVLDFPTFYKEWHS